MDRVTKKCKKWFKTHTYHHNTFSDIDELVRLKEEKGLTISVGIPTLNEEETIGKVIVAIQTELMFKHKLVDEIAVIDSDSTDKTREVAWHYGAEVYKASEYQMETVLYKGKGLNLWLSLYLLKGDILCWIDADIENIHPKFVYGLIGPLLKDEKIGYVKAFYERPFKEGKILRSTGGGRVTELTARPLLNILFPELSLIIQPLSGEYAGRRELLERLPFFVGYGVETGLLIDIVNKHGLNRIAQVDLDTRVHRNQNLANLRKMSFRICQVIFKRADELKRLKILTPVNEILHLINQSEYGYEFDGWESNLIEKPPMKTLKNYKTRRKELAKDNK